MKHQILCIIALVVATNAWAEPIRPASNPVPNQYIVVLNDDAFGPRHRTRSDWRRAEVQSSADQIARSYRGRAELVFTETLTGFSITMNARSAQMLANDPRVAYVAQDGWVHAAETDSQFDPPSWGLDRIDQHENTLDSLYQYPTSSSAYPVHAYIIDSGIRSSHLDFSGRVDTDRAFTAYNDGYGSEDCHGHGTHVAGVVGGDLYGVAKNVTLHSVRVLDCHGTGRISDVIAGVDWVTQQVSANYQSAVANMSLIAGASQALDDAVRASIAAGVTYVVAAGNQGADACQYSPARVGQAITVGGTTRQDQRVLSSNHGTCVDIHAPGAGIRSAFNRSDSDNVSMTGTSAAAPHVAGVAATLLGQEPWLSPAEVADLIFSHATRTPDPIGTDGNNLLAYGLIDLSEPEAVDSVSLDFEVDCHSSYQQCFFEAKVSGHDVEISRYFWDFGDGQARDHHRPTMRHQYQKVSGNVNVILAILLENGDEYLIDKEVALPF
jgi:subtilisin family serine protease